jgi:hypothetical protein
MSLPSESDLRTVIGKVIKIFDEIEDFGISNTPNFVTMQLDVLDETPNDSTPGTQTALAQLRGALVGTVSPSSVNACLNALWVTYGRVKLYPDLNVAAVLTRLYETFATTGTPVTVQSRNFTFGSFALTGTGTGTATRLTKDAYNYNIEAQFVAQAMTIVCTNDANSGGTLNAETFEYRGSAAGIDRFDITGSGITIPGITALSAESQTQFVTNGGFEGGTTTSDLPGWTIGTPASAALVTSDVYKSKLSTGQTSQSLRFTANNTATQTWNSRGGIQWNPAVPMFVQIAFKRESSCDGNLTIAVGGKSATVALSAQSGWTTLKFPLDYDSWLRRWDTNPMTGGIVVTLDSRTTGTLLIDDLIIAPYTNIEGTWVAIASGATPFLRGDSFAATDTGGTSGIIQTWLARSTNAGQGGFYFPSTTGSPVWADPT